MYIRSSSQMHCFAWAPQRTLNGPESMRSAEITSYKPTPQGTSSVLCGCELKPELCGLFPESVLSPLYGFFVVTGPSFCTKRCESLHHSFGL
jgi:hypothetical protein